MKAADLFKKNKPVIRKFKPIEDDDVGDMPYLWDQYRKGVFSDFPEDLSMQDFVEYSSELQNYIHEVWIVEDYIHDKLEPVALVFCKGDEWTLEPHVIYFGNATPRVVLRTYVAFLKKTKYRKDKGACLIRVEKVNTNLANRVEKMGLIEYVGKIWGGSPDGNQYLYSVRCGRRA